MCVLYFSASMEPSKFCMRIGKDDPNHGDYKMPFMAISCM